MRAIGISTIFAATLATACMAWAAEASQVSASYASLNPPKYPDDVSGTTPEGTVYLRVHVGIDGRPVSVDRAKVLPDTLPDATADRLAESAIAAVRTWTFEPAEHDGAKQESSVIVPVRFAAGPQSSSPDWTPPGSDVVLDEILTRKQ